MKRKHKNLHIPDETRAMLQVTIPVIMKRLLLIEVVVLIAIILSIIVVAIK